MVFRGIISVLSRVQALCEILTIAGKRLDGVTKKRPLVEGYFSSLEKLAKSGKLPSSRIRFLVRDLADLRRNKWVPRREKIQVRTGTLVTP